VEANINDQHRATPNESLANFDISDRIANNVEKLMSVESIIRNAVRVARDDGAESYLEVLERRIFSVRKRIDMTVDD